MSKENAKFTLSPRLLDHLGIAAYNSVQKCLAELTANAYDADAKNVHITLPDVVDGNAVISINDDGAGMSSDDLKTKFLYIGRDRRSHGEKTALGRLVIGSKGIGKLAGFGIASRIRLVTRKDGKQSTLTIDRKALESVSELTEHNFDILVSETSSADGTSIDLIQLHSGLQLPNADVVRRHLHKTMPAKPDFVISVNDIECSAEDIHGEKRTFAEVIPDIGTVSGFYIVANSRQQSQGLSVRVRGRTVQEPSLFGLDTRAHGFFTAEKIAGEINAEFLDPEQQGELWHDLIKTSRDGFLEDSDIVKTFNGWASGFVKKIVQGVDQAEIKKRTDALMDSPDIKLRIEELPEHIRGTASKVVRAIIAKLKTASDDDAKNLIEWILRYYESNVLKELMQAIAAADIQEAEILGALIKQWGLAQVNSVTKVIETQIDIIGKLEELIQSDKALEMDLHKLIENNLWLVKEGLELWSSDKPLKTLLDGHVDSVYADHVDIRPDLVCRTRDSGNEAVILEFKRPKEKVVMKHLTQALEYQGIIEKHRPNISITTYVVGRTYHPSVLSVKDKQAQAGLHLWSFAEILQMARARFESILKILGR